MEKLEKYLKSDIAAKLVFAAICLRFPLVFMPENLNGEWGYLLIYLASVAMEVYIWLTLNKLIRLRLRIRRIAPIILTIVGFMIIHYAFTIHSINRLIPFGFYSLIPIGKSCFFIILAIYFWSIREFEIPYQKHFAILLFLIHISQLSLLIFTGYPWHGVQLFISLTLFGLESLLFFYVYHIINWTENLPSEPEVIEKLIDEIGSDKKRG